MSFDSIYLGWQAVSDVKDIRSLKEEALTRRHENENSTGISLTDYLRVNRG